MSLLTLNVIYSQKKSQSLKKNLDKCVMNNTTICNPKPMNDWIKLPEYHITSQMAI